MRRLFWLTVACWCCLGCEFGCAKVNEDHVRMFVDALEALETSMAAQVNDPELEFAFTNRWSVSCKLNGVAAQGMAQGDDDDGAGPSPE